MSPLVIALPGNDALAARLAPMLSAELARAEFRRFPDEESYVRLDSDVQGRSVVLVSTLDRPDPKFLRLVFLASTARELGAARVGLIAPYLAYMRQDRRFQRGEAVASRIFAHHLSGILDWVITVDPHLHRISALSDIYTVPAVSVHASSFLADWIKGSIQSPLIVGPDEESEQWVAAVAKRAGAPFVILEKHRRGDSEVDISVPNVERWRGHTPVLVDDIISTARTMIETLGHLRLAGMRPAVCVAVHAVFAPGAFEALRAAGAARVVTTNTIPHETNAIDVTPALSEAVAGFIGEGR
jgi:ribose-phosphate pyrophosphokinase